MKDGDNKTDAVNQQDGSTETNLKSEKPASDLENFETAHIDGQAGDVYMHFVEDKDFKEPARKLLKKINLTKGARFESSRRNAESFRSSNLSIVVLSLYVLTITSVSIIFPEYLTDLGSQALGLLAIVMSSFIIAF